MRCTQILGLIVATATAIAAFPVQNSQEKSASLGKRFNYLSYDASDDSTNYAVDAFPFDYNSYEMDNGRSGNHLRKRFYYTRYVDNPYINSEEHRPHGSLAKRFYYTDYVQSSDDSESSLQDPPPFGYDKYGEGGDSSLAKRFYYTDYVQSNEDAESSLQDPPPFGYDKYGGGDSDHGLMKRFYYHDYDLSIDESESSLQDPPPFGYDKYGGGSNGLAKRFYYTRYVVDENVDEEEQSRHGGNKEANIASHEGKATPVTHHHHKSGSSKPYKHSKAQHGHG